MKLTFAVFTDLHSDGTPQQEAILRRAFRRLNDCCPEGIDALLMAGDYSFTGSEPEAIRFRDLLTSFVDPDRTVIVPACGNHDTCWKGCMKADGWNAVWAPVLRGLAPDSDGEHGNWHAVVGGYHFLTLEPYTYSPNLYTEETAAWLKTTMDKLTAENPEQYVFIATHGPAEGSGVYGADKALDGFTATWGWSPTLYDMLRNYPQAVLFTGHTHFPLNHERSIMQKDFTAVNAAALTGTCTLWPTEEAGWINPNVPHGSSQGLLVTVEDGALTMERLEFGEDAGDLLIGRWILPRPTGTRAHLKVYSPARDPQEAPVFTDRAVAITEVARGWYRIAHKAPRCGAPLHAYHYTAGDTAFSLFAEGKEVDFTAAVTLPKPPFTLSVVAEDIWGNRSEPMTATVATIGSDLPSVAPAALPQAVTEGALGGLIIPLELPCDVQKCPKVDVLLYSGDEPEGYSGETCALLRLDLEGGRLIGFPHDGGVVIARSPKLTAEQLPTAVLRVVRDEDGFYAAYVDTPQGTVGGKLSNFFFWSKGIFDLSHVKTAVR